MIPTYLSTNPFPDSTWSSDMKPIAVVDGTPLAISELRDAVSGDMAYFVGTNQSSFEKAIRLISTRVMHFYEMRVSDVSLFAERKELQELAIHWNTKLEDISPIAKLSNLKCLVLEDTPRLFDLSPLTKCSKLEALEFSGGMWKKNKTASLEPIASLSKLRKLKLLNLSVGNGGLKPLAKLDRLTDLELSNQFPTEDYAFLSVYLENVRCPYFVPYVKLPTPVGEKDRMVIGSRKPFLNHKTDSEVLAKYARQFENLRVKFAANKSLNTDASDTGAG